MSLSPRLEVWKNIDLHMNDVQITARDRVISKIRSGIYHLEEVPCFCGKQAAMPIAERGRFGLPGKTVLCMHCGLMRTTPRFTKEAAKEFYKNDYRDLCNGQMNNDELFIEAFDKGLVIMKEMPSLFAEVETIYDIGCGTGGMVSAFVGAEKSAAGCDIDDALLAVGKSRGLNLVLGGTKELLERNKKQADLIVIGQVAENLLDLGEELSEAVQAVRPGGYILVTVPGINNLQTTYGSNLALYLQHTHNYYFTELTLSYVLKSIGLQVTSANEKVVILAERPEEWSSGVSLVSPPQGEALRILSFVADAERKLIERQGSKKNVSEGKQDWELEPWPLATNATLRVLAWPNYGDMDSLTRMIKIAAPLFDMQDSVLCLRYNRYTDIPYDKAVSQLQHAFEVVGCDRDLKVLIVDDVIPDEDLPRLGKAASCVLQLDPDMDDTRLHFIHALGIEIISGQESPSIN